jgi:NAD(P)-dependent dehydrogenase (short-subunit alcohol dehydrogenase family)
MQTYQNRIAIVTGAASGIGRALVTELAARGAVVVLADIDQAAATEFAAALSAQGARATAYALDVRDDSSVQRLIDATVAAHGGVDYMFNNAGIGIAGEMRDLALEHWRRVLEVNLWGTIAGTHAAYRAMLARRQGHIVNVASLGGLIPFPSGAPYAATKHAIVGLSLSLRAEAEPLGIRVSVVCPAYVESNIYHASAVVNAERDKIIAAIPFRLVPAAVAARKILDGVARNRGIIVFPWYARLFWRLHRLHAALLAPLLRRTVEDFHGARIASSTE